MVDSTITPSSDATEDSRSTTPKWRTSLPWMAILLVLLVLACMGASAGIIIASNNQTVASWKVQPTVLLAVLSSVLNHALSTALYISVAITWWRSTLRGTTLARLHSIWDHGTGSSLFPNIF